jgi:prepilin-type processing-associated H-X9-DG protein
MPRLDEPPPLQPVPYADPSTPRPQKPLDAYAHKTVLWAMLLWLTPIPPLLSIGYGIIALHRTCLLRDRSYRFAWAGIIVSALALVGWMWVGVQILHAHESIQRMRCHENLRDLGHAISIYASEHHGRFPASWSDLAADGKLGMSGASLVCPSKLVADGAPSYVYCAQGLTKRTSSWRDIIAYEPPGAHGDGMIALFADGHQEWLDRHAAVRALQLLADRAAAWHGPTTSPTTNIAG